MLKLYSFANEKLPYGMLPQPQPYGQPTKVSSCSGPPKYRHMVHYYGGRPGV